MKKLVVPALLVAGLTLSVLVGATSVSWAQEAAPSCAQAISAFLDARVAFEKLPKKIDNPALVKLAEDAEKATATRNQRKDALKLAQDAAEAANASQPTTPVPNDRASVRARISAIEEYLKTATTDKVAHEAELAARNTELKAIDTLASAQSDLDAKTTAHQNAPRRVDNPALKAGKEFDSLVKTQNAADKACQGQPGNPGPANPTTTPAPTATPAPTTTPAPDDNGNPGPLYGGSSGADSVVTPVGGVETGGGPA